MLAENSGIIQLNSMKCLANEIFKKTIITMKEVIIIHKYVLEQNMK